MVSSNSFASHGSAIAEDEEDGAWQNNKFEKPVVSVKFLTKLHL